MPQRGKSPPRFGWAGFPQPLMVQNFATDLWQERIETLAVTAEHGIRAGLLPGPHRDPFDRILIAQALSENVPIVSNDRAFDPYGVNRIW